jgi:riboflavin synthase|uniref:riboflavin synthase n=1 Tax=Candidatus Planktophila sp. TaxID=2175601 RepID=UPI00404ADE00
MFTGLITEVGSISAITHGSDSAVLEITAPKTVKGVAIGDSIAVNGVCLTATSISDSGFTADVMVQTLKMTSLASYNVGDRVNLELAAKLEARMGGHMVQGHVDGVATVVSIVDGQKWQEFTVTIPANLLKYVVAQGSICLEGVSLTVGALNDANNEVTVWLIPETLAKTNLSVKKIGDPLNIEVDVLAKYVERLLEKR